MMFRFRQLNVVVFWRPIRLVLRSLYAKDELIKKAFVRVCVGEGLHVFVKAGMAVCGTDTWKMEYSYLPYRPPPLEDDKTVKAFSICVER